MIRFDDIREVYLISGVTDLRKGIDGYAAVISGELHCGFRKNCNENSEYLQLESGFSANAINSVIMHSFLNILTCGVQKLILCHL